jgi:hypothetical protein
MVLRVALSENNLTETIRALDKELPEKEGTDPVSWILDEFSDEFWRTITGQTDPPEEYIFYNQLAVETPLIGYLETGNDEDNSQLPWWLRSFNWTFEMLGQETLQLPRDDGDIDRVKDFDPSETRVYRPELVFDDDGADLESLLEGLVDLKNALTNSADIGKSERTVYEDSQDHPQLPADLFDLAGDTPIRTTGKFETCLQSLLQLCPPYNETITALTWYNTGLPTRAMEAMLEDDINHLRRAGLTPNPDRVWNESYREAVAQIMDFRGVFDWEVRNNSHNRALMEDSLEAAYIQMWLENTSPLTEKQAKAIRLAADRSRSSADQNEMEYAPCCIELPISFDRKRYNCLTFDTQRRKRNGGLYSGDESRTEAIIQTIEQADLFPDLNE